MKEKEKSNFRTFVLGMLALFGIFPLVFVFAIEFAKYTNRRSKRRRFSLAMKRFAYQLILLPKGSLSQPWTIKPS